MVNILKPKVEVSGIPELLAMGVVKSVAERALMPVIGNQTIKSGLIKGAVGVGSAKYLDGSIGRILGGAFIIDAVEDLVVSLVPPAIGGVGAVAGDDW